MIKHFSLIMMLVLVLVGCSNNSDKNNDLIEKENELLKKENELLKKEQELTTKENAGTNTTDFKKDEKTNGESENKESIYISFDNGEAGDPNRGARLQLLQEEINNSLNLVRVSKIAQNRIPFKKLHLEGRLYNDAAIAKFKDFVLSVELYSKTNTKLGAVNCTIYERIDPGKSLNFSKNITIPQGVKTFDITRLEYIIKSVTGY